MSQARRDPPVMIINEMKTRNHTISTIDITNEVKAQISSAIKCRQDTRNIVSQACRVAESFTKHYYKNFDRKRRLVPQMYIDTSVLLWNGTRRAGSDEIKKYLLRLPATRHTLVSCDVQRLGDPFAHELCFLVKTSGNIMFREITKEFTQTFILAIRGYKTVIISDCLRFKE